MNKSILLFCCTLSLAIVATTFTIYPSQSAQAADTSAQAADTSNRLPLKELRLFSTIYAMIKSNYVDEVENEKLIKGAINGMLATLDPYSVYMQKERYKNLQIGTTGKFGGLGIEVDMNGQFVEIVSPIDDTPASRAGLKSGDLIVKIDDTNVAGKTLSDAVKLMRGEIGTKIKISVKRLGVESLMDFELVRAEIKIKSTRQTLLEPNIGYIRISRFQVNTGQDMRVSFDKLVAENKGQALQGLVLDLRNNPGGVLYAAVETVDYFINPKQMVVYTKGRQQGSSVEYRSSKTDTSKDMKVVVLINKGSASASEIVTGALQDLKRATIIGEKSFGKGSVQTVAPLGKDAALKLTTAKYYTPSGRVIHGSGIEPDIKVPFKELTKEQVKERETVHIRKDLKRWLSYDSQIRAALANLKGQPIVIDDEKPATPKAPANAKPTEKPATPKAPANAKPTEKPATPKAPANAKPTEKPAQTPQQVPAE